MTNYLLVVLAVLLMAIQFVFNKYYQKMTDASIHSGLVYNVYVGLFIALQFWVMNGFKVEFTMYSFIMAALVTVFGMTYMILSFKIMSIGSLAVYTLFLMLGGVILPYIYGIAFLGEKITIMRSAGLILLVVSIILASVTKQEKKKRSMLFLGLCIIVFILNGCVSITSKLHQIGKLYEISPMEYVTTSTESFLIWGGLIKAVLSGVLLLFVKNPKKAESVTYSKPWAKIILILIIAVIGGLSYYLQLMGASNLPATVLYPMVSGGMIVATAIAGRIIFKEKLGKIQITGITLCFIATLCFL